MKHFLIQVGENHQVLHDFAFRLVEAIRFAEWKYGHPMYEQSFAVAGETVTALLASGVDREDIIPVGSLEFVFNRMQELGYPNTDAVKPLNVPPVLQRPEFLHRHIEAGLTKHDLLHSERTYPLFIKSADAYKGFTDIVEEPMMLHGLSATERFDVSEVVPIESEWRVFVQREEILGAHPYGHKELFPKPPNVRFLKGMLKTIERARQEGLVFPMSYTLDVGVSLDGSFLIECHPFVSCGLYGFEDMERLPSMMIQGFAFFKRQANELPARIAEGGKSRG